MKVLTAEQQGLFEKLDPIERGIAVATLSGLKPVQAFRMAAPEVTIGDAAARDRVKALLRKQVYRDFIDSVFAGPISDAIMSQQEALEKLTEIARANMGDMVEYKTVVLGETPQGDEVKQSVWKFRDTDDQRPEDLAAIAELKSGVNGLSIKLHSPLQAISQMAMIQGWNKPTKIDHSSPDGSMTPKPLDQIDFSKLSDSAVQEIAALYYEHKPKA